MHRPTAREIAPISPKSSCDENGCDRTGVEELARQICGVGVSEGEVIEAEEEHEIVKTQPAPYLPTQSEIDDHEIDHIPYRSWCKACVEGRGREDGHFAVEYKSRSVPTVGFDYLFVSKRGVFSKKDWKAEDDERFMKVLVVKDFNSKAVFAHAVQRKGVDDNRFAVDVLVGDIEWLGYSRIILRSDNEPAITALMSETMKAIKVQLVDQAMEEHPPPYDSQANGAIEVGVQIVRGMVRTWHTSLEERLGYRIPPNHPLMCWLVEHAAHSLTTRVKGRDGQTAYQRVRGKPWNQRLLGFGEMCRYKVQTKKYDQGTEQHRWNSGFFLVCARRRDSLSFATKTRFSMPGQCCDFQKRTNWTRMPSLEFV